MKGSPEGYPMTRLPCVEFFPLRGGIAFFFWLIFASKKKKEGDDSRRYNIITHSLNVSC